MANPSFTIVVNLSNTSPPTLTYGGSGPGGLTIGPKRHRIKNGCDVHWMCPQAPIFIQFTGSREIFANSTKKGFELSVSAPANTPTPALTTKNNLLRRSTKYFVAVASTPMAGEDPDLEDGGGGGGNGKKSTKKKAAKKAKATKARR